MERPLAAARSAVAETARTARVDDIVLSVHADMSAIEKIWRDLERRTAISIYQRFDWVLPWCRHAAPSLGIVPAVVLGSRRGRPVFLLPFGRKVTGFGTEISWLGCSHVNIGIGLFEPDFAASLDRDLTRELFRRVGAALAPADLMILHNQPKVWDGVANPMRHLAGRADDQPLLAIGLKANFDDLLNQRKRKKLRWQENALAAAGGYRFVRAADRAEAAAIFDTFLLQKEDQFARQGIDNVFADPGTVESFRSLITQSLGKADPAIQLFGIEIDGVMRATFGAGIHRGRVYGFFSGISFDEYQRVSPGELLLHHLVRDCCERGYEILDLGVGEERYKAAWSPVREAQFAAFVPLSFKGRLKASALWLAHVVKVRIRRNETAWRIAKDARELKARIFRRRTG